MADTAPPPQGAPPPPGGPAAPPPADGQPASPPAGRTGGRFGLGRRLGDMKMPTVPRLGRSRPQAPPNQSGPPQAGAPAQGDIEQGPLPPPEISDTPQVTDSQQAVASHERTNLGAAGDPEPPSNQVTKVMPAGDCNSVLYLGTPMNERDLYWAPSRHAYNNATAGGGKEGQQYLPSDDGFYVDHRPYEQGRRKNWFPNKVEMRVRNETGHVKGRKDSPDYWFGEDGRMHCLGHPLTHDRSRPARIYNPRAAYFHTTPASPYPMGVRAETPFQLDLEIGRLELSGHPLMIREDWLAAQLLQTFKEYKRRERVALPQFYTQKLGALEESLRFARDARGAIEGRSEGRHRESATTGDRIKMDELTMAIRRVEKLESEVREARQVRDAEEDVATRMVDAMSGMYRDMEACRQAQSFRSTSLLLTVHDVPYDHGASADREQVEVRGYVADLEARHDAEQERTVAAYQGRRSQLEDRLEAHRARQSSGEGDEEEERILDDLDALGDPPRAQPFDDVRALEDAADAVHARHARLRRVPALSSAFRVGPLQEGAALPRDEARRRQRVANTRLYVKVFVNNKEVGCSEERALKEDFALEFHNMMAIHLLRWPDSARARVYEKALPFDRLLAEVYVAVPGGALHEPPVDAAPVAYQFTCDSPFQPGWGQAGQQLFTAGSLFLQCRWQGAVGRKQGGDMEVGQPLAPPPPKHAAETLRRSAVGGVGQVSTFKLAEWLQRAQVDPNDPRNADLLELLKVHEAREMSGGHYRVDADDELVEDGTIGPVNRRHQGLRIRWDRLMGHGGMEVRQIPLDANDVDENLVDPNDASRLHNMKLELSPSGEAYRAVFARRGKMHDFLSRVRQSEQRISSRRSISKQLKVDDVVRDSPLPEFRLDLAWLKDMFAPRRDLRPRRRPNKILATSPDHCEFVISVQKAYNLPVRRTDGIPEEDFGKLKAEQRLEPFVEVAFREIRIRSRSSSGQSPLWNEQVAVPFTPAQGGWAPSALQSSREMLHINVYDELPEARGQGNRHGQMAPRARGEKGHPDEHAPYKIAPSVRRFLGRLSIPVGSIYRMQTVEGTFQLQVPAVLNGYRRDPGRLGPPNITVYISLKPLIARPMGAVDEWRSGENPELLHYSRQWLSDLRGLKQCRNRVLKVTAGDVQGSATLICRYIAPLMPPPPVAGTDEAALRRQLRFVSLIPYVEDSAVWANRGDVWATASEFLEMCAGDHEEHAHLLCNYFIAANVDAYVAMGTGVRAAEASYVVTLSGGGVKIWNTIAGQVTAANDVTCQLREIGTIYNHRNIWANVQNRAEPWMIAYDLNNANNWRPFFDKSRGNPPVDLATVQVQPEYKPLGRSIYDEIEATIERQVQVAFENARAMAARERQGIMVHTSWLRPVCRELKHLLKTIEEDHLALPKPERRDADGGGGDERGGEDGGGEGGAQGGLAMGGGPMSQEIRRMEDKHRDALARAVPKYEISGFPLQVPFTDETDIAELVLNCGIHKDYTEDVKFALAVHVAPYQASFAMAIWVYIAALHPKR